MLWGQFGGLYAALGQTTIEITAAYRSDGFGTWGPTEHTTVSVVEVFSYLKTEAVDPDGARQSAKQLKRIADLLEQRLPRRRV